jgi:hypothetical protein
MDWNAVIASICGFYFGWGASSFYRIYKDSRKPYRIKDAKEIV